MVVKVEHPNGYSGMLYGESSMVIFDKDGHEVLHTSSRTPQTEEDLWEVLETTPELLKILYEVE